MDPLVITKLKLDGSTFLKDVRTERCSLWPLWILQHHDIPNYLECDGQSIT